MLQQHARSRIGVSSTILALVSPTPATVAVLFLVLLISTASTPLVCRAQTPAGRIAFTRVRE